MEKITTKAQLRAQVSLIIAENTTYKGLQEALSLVMNEYCGTLQRVESDTKTVDGIEYKYCTRHAQYEPLEGFKVDGNGKRQAMCDVAYEQWKQMNNTISSMEKKAFNMLDDIEAMREYVKEINKLKEIRSGHSYSRENVVGAL